jgi:hypothetical protein
MTPGQGRGVPSGVVSAPDVQAAPAETTDSSHDLWVLFSAIMLLAGGCVNLLSGLVAVEKGGYFDNHLLFSSLKVWGWTVVGAGVVSIAAGALLFFNTRPWARWLAVGVCFLDAILQTAFFRAFPFWSALTIGLDGLVIYGLVVHGGQTD